MLGFGKCCNHKLTIHPVPVFQGSICNTQKPVYPLSRFLVFETRISFVPFMFALRIVRSGKYDADLSFKL